MTVSELGQIAWRYYCLAADGKTFDGKPLPTWEELGRDRQLCWEAAASAVAEAVGGAK